MRTLDDFIHDRMQDPEFASEYEALELPFQIAQQVIELRQSRGLSQKGLARLVSTKQPGISRLENALSTPSVSFLQRIAEALDAQLEIRFVKNEELTAS
jgi:transcriptional regulator with XRE-family HTH domain